LDLGKGLKVPGDGREPSKEKRREHQKDAYDCEPLLVIGFSGDR
jgi:hypothetical protein